MKEFFALIGLVFCIMCIFGAVIPGWNFHVFFGGDKAAQKYHERKNTEMLEDMEKNNGK